MKRTATSDETQEHKRVRTTDIEKFNHAHRLLMEVRSELFGTKYSEDVAKVQRALDTTVDAVNHTLLSLRDNNPPNTSSLISLPAAPQPPTAPQPPEASQPLPSITPQQYIQPTAHGVNHNGKPPDFELLLVIDKVESWRCLNCGKTLKPFLVDDKKSTRRTNFFHHRSRKGHCTHPQSKAMAK